MALPGDPTTEYGIRIRVTPSTENSWRAATVLYSSDAEDGDFNEVARNSGTGVWYFDDVLTVSTPRRFYECVTEQKGYADSDTIGHIDAEPTDLNPAT